MKLIQSRLFRTAEVLLLALGGQMVTSVGAEAHRFRHSGTYCYQGSVSGSASDPWLRRAANTSRHNDKPTLSQRIGTN